MNPSSLEIDLSAVLTPSSSTAFRFASSVRSVRRAPLKIFFRILTVISLINLESITADGFKIHLPDQLQIPQKWFGKNPPRSLHWSS